MFNRIHTYICYITYFKALTNLKIILIFYFFISIFCIKIFLIRFPISKCNYFNAPCHYYLSILKEVLPILPLFPSHTNGIKICDDLLIP